MTNHELFLALNHTRTEYLEQSEQAIVKKRRGPVRLVLVAAAAALLTGSVLAASGNNDNTEDGYGVFVINESDYMWYNDNESRIKQTAANLKSYLDEKLAEEFDAPIFVVSHLGVHYNHRTKSEGFAKYGKYIFDVVNEAGAEGLNIIFLFGHNHSEGRDDDLGASPSSR